MSSQSIACVHNVESALPKLKGSKLGISTQVFEEPEDDMVKFLSNY